MDHPTLDDLARVRAERDLYRRLLALGAVDDLPTFLQEALSAIVEISRANKGYLEVREVPGDPGSRRWSMAHECTTAEIEAFRETISSGIIAEALARGETISSAAAVADPRFKHRPSVAAHQIQAVLCAPVGKAEPLGVVYLQGRGGLGPFPDEDRDRVELFATHLAPFADRLLARQREVPTDDPTQPWREVLDLSGFVTRSPAMAEVLRMVSIAAPTAISVLLTGPTGTGKSQLARIIHHNSPRKQRPVVELNCGAIPEGLVESELFGALKGSFTGASRRIRGKVEAADGGTLLLDEVGDLPLAVQVKLLTLLQSGVYYHVGDERPSRADIRVIAATNVDLEGAVAERRFREDLFHRLNVVRIDLPPLSGRREDVVPLARHFCAQVCERHGVDPIPLSTEACQALWAAEWPGNIRSLGNKVEWAVLQAAAEGARSIEARHLQAKAWEEGDEVPRTWNAATRAFQRGLLLETLRACGWNRTETARRLEISRGYLYQAMSNLGVELPRE